jgi:ABC-type nickel/cobalt efflux system permease component RcnA
LISILLLGFVIGVRHAFEADHLAAVSALVSRGRSVRSIAPQGAVWGAGHTLALVVLSGAVLLTPWTLPAGFTPALEAVVGGVLVLLGAHLLLRLWRDRVHVHAHRHGDGVLHLHAHSHRDDPAPHEPARHEDTAHEHEHPAGLRTLLVGLTHGAAGSAALTVYVAATLDSPWTGVLYVFCFGAGSILGMAVLSTVIAWPLTRLASRVTWMHRALQVAAGAFSIGVGLHLAATQLGSLW